MPRNIEIKARLRELGAVLERVCALGDGPPRLLRQTDTFFAGAQGRLKLRDFGDGTGELIHYRRPDSTGPKASDYAIVPTAEPAALLAVLSRAFPVAGVVEKKRALVMSGRTRIHLDEVAGLGWFLELEVVMGEGEPAASGEAEARSLLDRLGIGPQDLVAEAYLDLLTARRSMGPAADSGCDSGCDSSRDSGG